MERTKCECYSRIMWYIRGFNSFNIWKKSEFKERKNFDMEVTMNSKFIEDFK